MGWGPRWQPPGSWPSGTTQGLDPQSGHRVCPSEPEGRGVETREHILTVAKAKLSGHSLGTGETPDGERG